MLGMSNDRHFIVMTLWSAMIGNTIGVISARGNENEVNIYLERGYR